MKYVELFAGIGGFGFALNKLGHQCIYVNEWDKYAAQTYEKNFKRKVDTRSITDVRENDVPDHDLLVAGFPCQAFSVAGKRKGFNDTRGTLFFDIARIVKKKRPRYLLLENVKGLLSHDQGRTYKIILSALTELGYDIQSMVLNSKNFGVPQNRERVFIVGHLRGQPRPQVFPIEGKVRSNNEQVHPTLDANYYKGYSHQRKMIARMPLKYLNRNQRDINGDYSYTVDGANTGGLIEMTRSQQQGMRVYDPRGVSTTLAGQAGGWGAKTGLYATPKIRRLTPVECLRLQGFPDDWFDVEGLSDSQKYKQIGNAVTVNVVYEIAKRL